MFVCAKCGRFSWLSKLCGMCRDTPSLGVQFFAKIKPGSKTDEEPPAPMFRSSFNVRTNFKFNVNGKEYWTDEHGAPAPDALLKMAEELNISPEAARELIEGSMAKAMAGASKTVIPAGQVECPQCHGRTPHGRFCGLCGAPLTGKQP
jgi:hypothetical protein